MNDIFIKVPSIDLKNALRIIDNNSHKQQSLFNEQYKEIRKNYKKIAPRELLFFKKDINNDKRYRALNKEDVYFGTTKMTDVFGTGFLLFTETSLYNCLVLKEEANEICDFDICQYNLYQIIKNLEIIDRNHTVIDDDDGDVYVDLMEYKCTVQYSKFLAYYYPEVPA